jgi:hypothetical protein
MGSMRLPGGATRIRCDRPWATADRIGVKYLLTEVFQDRRVLGGVTFVNPFQGGNEPLLEQILPLS